MKTTTKLTMMLMLAAMATVRPDALGAQQTVLRGQDVFVAPGCPAEGRGWLGITAYRCRNCAIVLNSDDRIIGFGGEPVIAGVHAEGPAVNRLRTGDVVVSVGGDLITTGTGQLRLAEATVGVPVEFVIRRGGSEERKMIVPAAHCLAEESAPEGVATGSFVPDGRLSGTVAVPSFGDDTPPNFFVALQALRTLRALDVLNASFALGKPSAPTTVEPRVAPPAREPPAAVLPPRSVGGGGYLGLGFRVTRGTVTLDDGGATAARFSEPPEIVSVDPDGPAARVGIEPGDLVLLVDGMDVTTPGGASRLVSAGPGESLRVVVRKPDGAHANVRLSIAEAPTPPAAAPPASTFRYSGGIGPADVSVWGSPVTVEEDRESGVLIIRTADTVIRVSVGSIRR